MSAKLEVTWRPWRIRSGNGRRNTNGYERRKLKRISPHRNANADNGVVATNSGSQWHCHLKKRVKMLEAAS